MPPELLSLFDLLPPAPAAAVAPVPVVIAPTLGYRIPASGRGLAAGWKNRAIDNIQAIRVAKALLASGAPADGAQLEALARYTGWGATDLAQALFPVGNNPIRAGWEDIARDLETVANERERRAMASSTQYAHYTPLDIMQAIWSTLVRLGFVGGRVIEPGCGIGLFMATAPELDDIRWTGIEMDPTTAAIARLLQPTARIVAEDFARVTMRNPVDLAIGNPPFSATTIRGQGHAGKLGLRLHDYFIARSLELVRDGGLAAFVTSHGTMDKRATKAREYIGSIADLIGAVRLPQGAMREEAGTDVVVDLLFFRRTNRPTTSASWLETTEITPRIDGDEPMYVNAYFAAHPELVIGEHAWTTSAFGPVYTVKHPTPNAYRAELDAAIERFAGSAPAVAAPSVPPTRAIATSTAPAPMTTLVPLPASAAAPTAPRATAKLSATSDALTTAERAMDAAAYPLKEGSYAVDASDRLCQFVDGELDVVPIKADLLVPGLQRKAVAKIRAFIDVRNALRAVITAQANDQPYEGAQARLRKAYDTFVRSYGPINLTKTSYRVDPETNDETPIHRRPNISPLADDPDCWLVASIERYEPDTHTASYGPIFTERVIYAPAAVNVESPQDALAACLDELGYVDINHIATLLDMDRHAAIAELGDAIYPLPDSDDVWVTADEYLSGNVREKLLIAQAAAEKDPVFERNVEALKANQPKDLNPSDISARLGAPWIPASDIEQFIYETMEIKTAVSHTPEVAIWDLNVYPFSYGPKGTSEWGTSRRNAGQLMLDALNGAIPQIFDTIKNANGNDTRVLNAVDTEAAREKLSKIKEAFAGWIWKDQDRATRLVRTYNTLYNDLVPRHFDGSHLTLRGAAATIVFNPHQKRGVWRIITSGNTYLAHSVGAGKTFEIAAACMEQRRIGLVTKPMILVPGHCLAQFSREFLQLYPMANILVADESNFEKSKRDRFIARATTGSWDAIIITHSAFKFIETPKTFEEQMINEQIDVLNRLMAEHKAGGGDNVTRKKLAQRQESLKRRFEALKGRKDNMVTIQDIGIDQLIVDEAQQFRKLSFVTSAGMIKGIDADGSQRAWDLYVKSKYIATIQPKRALVLASGTPITNTLGELFSIQRLCNEAALREKNIGEFDAWRAIFGETVTELELQPSGSYKPVTRFSQFENLPELIAMFRSFADIVQHRDLRELITLPAIKGGSRAIVTGETTESFKAYQRFLAERIDKIQNRTKENGNNDIILSVITDGRHAAIDTRLVVPDAENEPGNKLNVMIENVFRIYTETSGNVYYDAAGRPDAKTGATQMIFSDIGTESVARVRGFSAYGWIRQRLIELGVPPAEIVFMQDVKRTSEKQALFNAVNAGHVRILIGSTPSMGTGVNCQKRLIALHHLDVPWIPSDIEQREGRIVRQGNQNDEVQLYAYATPGSMDGALWQMNERKFRFISAAMAGDTSIRRIDDIGSQANSFAMAKAIASGNPLLMQKAGLDADIARLRRLRSAHFDDQYSLRGTIAESTDKIRIYEEALLGLKSDVSRMVSTRGDDFRMAAFGKTFTSRVDAGNMLISHMYDLAYGDEGAVIGSLGGFDVVGRIRRDIHRDTSVSEYGIQLTDRNLWPQNSIDTASGLIRSLEHMAAHVPDLIAQTEAALASARRRLRDATPRVGKPFEYETELEGKLAELGEIEAQLIAESEAADAARRAAAGPTLSDDAADDSDGEEIAA